MPASGASLVASTLLAKVLHCASQWCLRVFLSQVLRGHSAAILHIVVSHRDGQVLSFSKDMVREG